MKFYIHYRYNAKNFPKVRYEAIMASFKKMPKNFSYDDDRICDIGMGRNKEEALKDLKERTLRNFHFAVDMMRTIGY
jgi:hypothetical protein